MRITKGKQALGGNHGITQCVGAITGGVVIHATNNRGTVTRIFISGSEMEQITAAIADCTEVREAREARRTREARQVVAEDGHCIKCLRPMTNHDLNEQQTLCVPCRCF